MAPQVGSQRRDVRKHIEQALAKRPGTFLTIREIADTPTDEYDGNPAKPSYGAISTNLVRDGGIPGIETGIVNGFKGARSIVIKKPAAKRARTPQQLIDREGPKRARTPQLRPEVQEAVKAIESPEVRDFVNRRLIEVEEVKQEGANGSAAKKERPGRQAIDLKPGRKANQGILDRLHGVVYCNVMLEPGRQRTWPGANEEIVGREEFVTWLNKKNGPYFNGERFEIIDVVGADRDQRENSGINRFYDAWLDEAEEFRISAAMKMLLDTYTTGVTFHPASGKWRFNSQYELGNRGGQFILFLAEHGKISVRTAHRVFLSYILEQFGEEFTAKIDLPTDEDIKSIEAQVARLKAEREKNAK